MLLFRLAVAAVLSLTVLSADDLSRDKLSLLRDSGGWEYLSMNDSQNGFPTQHVCFDGNPHPGVCSGLLTFTGSDTFTQTTTIDHQDVSRHGTYKLTGNQLAFFDEFGNQDGPYSIDIDPENKLMSLDAPQVKIRLQLYKEYKKKLEEKNKARKK